MNRLQPLLLPWLVMIVVGVAIILVESRLGRAAAEASPVDPPAERPSTGLFLLLAVLLGPIAIPVYVGLSRRSALGALAGVGLLLVVCGLGAGARAAMDLAGMGTAGSVHAAATEQCLAGKVTKVSNNFGKSEDVMCIAVAEAHRKGRACVNEDFEFCHCYSPALVHTDFPPNEKKADEILEFWCTKRGSARACEAK